MGIKGLVPFLQDAAPKAVKQKDSMKSFTGKIVAIDASMCLYQFLIAIRTGEGENYGGLENKAGETTSHIVGFLTRTLKILESGVKPVFVFDGKPPELKAAEVNARREKKQEAVQEMAKALAAGDGQAYEKAMDRTVRGTKKQNEDVKRLLRLMGVPVIDAEGEAEATCAVLCSDNMVYGTATEDADCLTFGSKKLIRNLFATDYKKRPILEIDLELVLKLLDINMDQFIEFCILSGCDYTNTIRGVGSKTAFRMIKQYQGMEGVIQNLDTKKHPLPEPFLWKEALQEFKAPAVTRFKTKEEAQPHLAQKPANYEELTTFLRDEMNFAPDRIAKAIQRLKVAKERKTQISMTAYIGEQKPIIKPEDIYNPFRAAPKTATKTQDKTDAVSGEKRRNLTASSLAKKKKTSDENETSEPEDEDSQ